MSDSSDKKAPEDLCHCLQQARRVVVLTGAGVSAESGIPTFREAQTGLWARFDPMTLASPEGFDRDPALVWRWYQWRRQLVAEAQPNAGHLALARLERLVNEFVVITQNVDGLHQQAGSSKVLELHGNIGRTICSETRQLIPDDWLRDQSAEPPPSPHHPQGLARPDVVWFGEMLNEVVLDAAMRSSAECDVMIVAGTAGVVQPAASLPAVAREAGAKIVDVNPDAGDISRMADWHLKGCSGTWLPRLVDCFELDSNNRECG
ncbi:MAG: NAD-dependent deacylase [Wenzhouxiangella sp.]|nr:NAD-dependent deacylase [Wenzhouxiangella sp.]